MPAITRREFLEWAGTTGVTGALLSSMPLGIGRALERVIKEYPLIWLQLSNCSGCSVSAINTIHPGIENVLLDQIIPSCQLTLRFQRTVMSASGALAIRALTETKEEWKGK